ncbi:hypothetical protein VSP77_13115 [Myroides odoratimimus]|uniref:ATP-grasp domain-containing protein n=1 Tax=Myroides odoratimimus TaxID=76832 RepID=UPI002DBBA3CD|nr:hypothetical protein [Myroides odoratimimus]MEC4008536.1 hypothetical protein [Myroides odoratimimus]
MSLRSILKDIVLRTPFLLNKYIEKQKNLGIITTYEEHLLLLEEAEKVILSDTIVDKNFKIGLVKDDVFAYDRNFLYKRSYYPKYERFLKNNNLNYDYYNAFSSNWLEEAKKYDLIIWHTASDPCSQKMAKNKIYVLDKILNKKCLPSYDEIWGYEDKVNAHYFYKAHSLPEIPTYVSHDKEDVVSFLNETKYPIISKLTTGSASYGVEKINNKNEAMKLVNKVFGDKGLKTYFPFERQKNYVYFQQFIDDATYDLRVITVGDKALGYYRFPNEGDFRASGAGNYAKKEIPVEALDLAFKVKELYGANFLATDLLYSEKNKQYYIIESSIFIGVDTPRQLEIDGVSGYYKRNSESKYEFVKGKFWIQELALCELLGNLLR